MVDFDEEIVFLDSEEIEYDPNYPVAELVKRPQADDAELPTEEPIQAEAPSQEQENDEDVVAPEEANEPEVVEQQEQVVEEEPSVDRSVEEEQTDAPEDAHEAPAQEPVATPIEVPVEEFVPVEGPAPEDESASVENPIPADEPIEEAVEEQSIEPAPVEEIEETPAPVKEAAPRKPRVKKAPTPSNENPWAIASIVTAKPSEPVNEEPKAEKPAPKKTAKKEVAAPAQKPAAKKAAPAETAPKKAPSKKAPATQEQNAKKASDNVANAKKTTAKKAESAAPVAAKAPAKKSENNKNINKEGSKTMAKDAEKDVAKKAPAKTQEAPAEKVIIEGDPTQPHGKFVVKKTDKGNFVYKLYSSNRRVLAAPGGAYKDLAACKGGIQSVINNAATAPIEDQTLKNPVEQKCPKWEIYLDKANEYRLRLLASNGNVVAITNDGYLSKDAAKKGIDAIARAAKGADVVRNDDLW